MQNLEGQLEQARRVQTERTSRRSELNDSKKKLCQESEGLRKLQEDLRAISAPLEQLRKEVGKAELSVSAEEQSEASCRFTLDVITRSSELRDLLQRQKDVAAAQQRLDDAQSRARQILVTDESLRRIRLAADTANQAAAQLSVSATRISFEIPGDRLAGIEVDGTPLASPPAPIEAVRRVDIDIPERGRIKIDPTVTDRDQLLDEERTARTALNAELEQAGAKTLAQAEILRDQRSDLEVTAAAARQELDRLVPSGEVSALQNRIDELRLWHETLPSDWQAAEFSEREHAEAALHHAQTQLQNAREDASVARAAMMERESSVSQFELDMHRAQSAVEFQNELVELRQKELQSEIEAAPDDQLAAAVDAAARAAATQRGIISALEAEWSAGVRPQLEARIARLETTIRKRANRRENLRTDIARLRERIESRDSAGIDEAIEHTQHALEKAKRLRDRIEREIEVLNLLRETLRDAENEAKERYLAPVLNRVRPYLQMLFTNAEIKMDEDLKITGMSRNSGYEERFDHLSMGTQEQIAVLVRLAFAEMLINRGAPAAVILDDALVFSDDRRMGLMFDILSYAAQRVQIVVFTCREQLFEDLGAHEVQLVPADPESLRSA